MEILQDLNDQDLTRFLPSTGVTALLSAMMFHLMDTRSSDKVVRTAGLRRFYQSMQVLQALREVFASADFAFSMLEAAIHKAESGVTQGQTPGKHNCPRPTAGEQNLSDRPVISHNALTPSPELHSSSGNVLHNARTYVNEAEMNSGLVPVQSNTRKKLSTSGIASVNESDMTEFENNHVAIDDLMNFDSGEGLFAAADGVGFHFDMNWMTEMPGMADILGGDLMVLDDADTECRRQTRRSNHS